MMREVVVATRMGAEIELISATGGEVMIGSDDDRMGLRVGAVGYGFAVDYFA